MSNQVPIRDDEVLNLFSRTLKSKLGEHLKRLILYGSRARGDPRPDSDYDCLAVVDAVSPELREAIYEIGGDFLYEHGALFSVIPVTEERFRRQTVHPLFVNVRRDGVTL